VRGFGGRLVDARRAEFYGKIPSDGQLAPRDIVARAIDTELKKSGAPCVFLDITHKNAEEIKIDFRTFIKTV
jgi:L-aspartate oxidase